MARQTLPLHLPWCEATVPIHAKLLVKALGGGWREQVMGRE
jgi:hypothetical protein